MKTLHIKNLNILTKGILLLVFGIQFSPLCSQNYLKEVWEEMDKTDRFSNLMKLSQLQGIYPDRAVIYFLLGNIYEEYMREADPLVLYDVVKSNYYQFTNNYGLLKLKLDDKQANQYREYFGPVEIISDRKKAHLEDILHEIGKRSESAEEYFKNATNVHNNYVRCITRYHECLFRFREITRTYPDIKTLFLLTDQRLKTDIANLSRNFDSVLVYFNAYKEACKKIPSLQKINDYQLNTITTYRLEGLTETDFYSPVVRLWNYSEWAEQFLQTLGTDISEIRKGTESSNRELSEKSERLKAEAVYYHQEIREPSRDKLYYLTGKYDYASITNQLLTYRKQKLHYLSLIRSGVNDPEDIQEFELSPKLMFYKDLADRRSALNAFAEQMKKATNAASTSKYIQFFFDHFKGMEGFARWCEMEKSDNNQIFDRTLSNLEHFLDVNRNLYPYRDSNLTFNQVKLPFGVQKDPGNTGKDTLVTLRVTPFQKRWYFLGGLEYKAKGNQDPFLAKVNPEGQTDWMTAPLPKGSKYTGASIHSVQVTVDSTCWVFGSASLNLADSGRKLVTFKTVINWKGKTVSHFITDTGQMPVHLWVDDVNEQYLTVTEGSPDQTGTKPLHVKLFDFRDSLVWEHALRLKGNLCNVLVTNSDFYLTFTCTALELSQDSGTSPIVISKPAIAGIYIRRNGIISHINRYMVSGEIEMAGSEKVYDNTLQIFARYTYPGQSPSYLYLLTDNQGRPSFSNNPEFRFETTPLSQ